MSKKKYKIKELLLKNIFHHQKLACLLLSLKRWNKTKTLLLDCNMDFFWGSSFFLRDHTVPNWSGFYDLVFSWKLSWKIKCGFSTYRRPKSEWFFVHLYHTRIRHCSSKVSQCWNTSNNLWLTTIDKSYRNSNWKIYVYSHYPRGFPFDDEPHGKCRHLDERVCFTDELIQIKYRWAYDHRQSYIKSLTGTLTNVILFTNQAADALFSWNPRLCW